jgi:hypothetical protein
MMYSADSSNFQGTGPAVSYRGLAPGHVGLWLINA